MISARMGSFLRKNDWVLNLLFISLGSYFVGGVVSGVVAHKVRTIPSADAVPAAQPLAPAVAVGQEMVHSSMPFGAIAERNLLALKRENLRPVAPEATETAPDGVAGKSFNESELRPCTLTASLRGTIVAEDEPQWSIAILFSNNEREAGVYTINEGGNQITEDAVLVQIRSREIIVRRRDHFERCLAEGEGGANVGTQAAMPPGGMLRPEDAAGAGGGGVTRVSETQYRVERSELDRVLGNLNEVATQARIVPSFKNGKANGFKLFSIKPGSIYSKIGLQNGDVIQKINGYDMNSPEKALEIYQKLKDSTSIAVSLERRGQPMNFSYNIP